jgi:hypothetical protein
MPTFISATGKHLYTQPPPTPLQPSHARLVEKNVAEEVSSRIASAVGSSLLGQAMPTFGPISATVKHFYTILTPRYSLIFTSCPPPATPQARLVEKNVAEEVSSRIASAVGSSLLGQAMPTFGSVSATVKSAMAEALQRVLSPSRRIDVLHEIEGAKQVKGSDLKKRALPYC